MAKEQLKTAEQFAKDHWKEIFAISGSAVGGAILLLVGYHRHCRTDEEGKEEVELKQLEAEAILQIDETAKLLETGTYAVDNIPQVAILAKELSVGLGGRAKEVMDAIMHMAVLKRNRDGKNEEKDE
jgi:hypothetical protein